MIARGTGRALGRALGRAALLLAATLAAATLIAGCSIGTARPDPTGIVVLVDVSGSTAEVREEYLANFQRVLDGCQGGERLFVIPINASSLVEPVRVAAELPAREWLKTEFTWKRELKRTTESLTEQVSDLLQQPPAQQRPGSAILDAIDRAADVLKPYRQRHLVIISDMIEQSDLTDFSRLDAAQVPQVLAQLQNRTVELNAQVHVAGITDGAGEPPLTSAQVMAIRSFWSAFFEERGSRLDEYGPTLLTFRTDG